LTSTQINTAHHTALSTKGDINIANLENSNTKGIFSLKSDGNTNLQNTQLKAGAVLIEANSFNSNEVEIITDVPFLIFDPKEQQAHDDLWNKSKLTPCLVVFQYKPIRILLLTRKKYNSKNMVGEVSI
jgi:filamentous hemagglutinin